MVNSFDRRRLLQAIAIGGLGGAVAADSDSSVNLQPMFDTDPDVKESRNVPGLEEALNLPLKKAKQLTEDVIGLGTELFGGTRCEGAICLGPYEGWNRYATIVGPQKENDNYLVVDVCLGLDEGLERKIKEQLSKGYYTAAKNSISDLYVSLQGRINNSLRNKIQNLEMLYFYDADRTGFLSKNPDNRISLVTADTNILVSPVDELEWEGVFYKKIRKAYIYLLKTVADTLKQEISLRDEPGSDAAILARKISDFGLI